MHACKEETPRHTQMGPARLWLTLFIACCLLLPLSSPADDAAPGLRLATASEQGSYTAFGRNLQNIAAGWDHPISIVTTQGSVENLQLIQRGEIDAALVQNDIAYYHYYDKKLANRSFRSALPLFAEYFQIIVREDSGILHIDSLVGKRIALGRPGSGSYRNARDILKTAEISYTSVPVASMEQALEKLAAGEVDALCYTSAAPPPMLREPGSNLRLLSLPVSLTDQLAHKYPYFLRDYMKLQQRESINTLSLTTWLVLAENLPDEAADRLMKLIFDHGNELANPDAYELISREALSIAIQRKPAPLHPRAERLLIDKGYLFDPWAIAYYLLALALLFVFVQLFAHALTTRCDRLGNLKPIRSLWRYRMTLLIQGLAVLIATLTMMALMYFLIMLFIQYHEGRYATTHNLYNPFAIMSIPELLLWLWNWIGGYDSGVFPQSTPGKILVVFPPLIGLFSIGWLVFSIWKDAIGRRVAEQMGAFVPPLENHILICGWNEKARGIIFGLTTPYAPERKKVVVIAEIDEETPLKKFGFPRGMVHYCRGDSSDTKALEAAHVENASAALILAGDKKKHAKNIGSVLTTLAIKRLHANTFAVAELRHQENTEKFEDCGVDALVYGESIIYRLAAQACFNPLATGWFFDMITHDEHAE
ncbi:MAG TPA: TAXI family TRAP transporter solute-binding subunit, partial [Chromatiaceae bacterium]|nr:TAXI family TRAP transporter solute-binding subunit [Chromatiaceae bacterium]